MADMTRELTISTPGQGLHLITGQVSEVVRDAGQEDGLCTIFIRHTSASLVIQENADPSARRDLERGFARAVEVGRRVFLRYPTARDRGEFMGLKRASRRFLSPWEATPTNGLDTFGPLYYARFLKNRRNELNHRFVICGRDDGTIKG